MATRRSPKVRDVMTTDVVTAAPETPFPELVDTLLRFGINGLPVVRDGRLLGIVTEADLVSKEAYGERPRRLLDLLADLLGGGEPGWVFKGRGHIAAEIMTDEPATVAPTAELRHAARLMVERGCTQLPVVEDDQLVGIIARIDVLRVLHRTDDDLAADVARLLADPMESPEGHDVHATVDDGIVTLHGSVRFPADRTVLEAVVWRVPGVVDVCDATDASGPDGRRHRGP